MSGPHVLPVRVYLGIFAALCVLTAEPDRPPEPLPARAITPRWGANPTLGTPR